MNETRYLLLTPKVRYGRVTGVDVKLYAKNPLAFGGVVIKVTLTIDPKVFAPFVDTEIDVPADAEVIAVVHVGDPVAQIEEGDE